jgi:hypothetical protein
MIWAGKRIDELSRDELVKCCLHFRDAHLESLKNQRLIIRHMKKMELALTADQIKQLDWWLARYRQDTEKGDGTDKYYPWTMFEADRRGGYTERFYTDD